MRALSLTFSTVLLLAAAPAFAQTAGLYRPAPQKEVPAGNAAQAMSPIPVPSGRTSLTPNATGANTNGGLTSTPAMAAAAQKLPTASTSTALPSFAACAYVLSEQDAKKPGAQVQKTADTMRVTYRNANLMHVSSCARDGKLTYAIQTVSNQALPPIQRNPNGTLPAAPGTVVRQQQR